ncbi:MAG: DNA repair protein RecO [Candidatus Hydrogenedentota bacterium]
MSQERTEALVLRGVDFSETSRIVTFLTPDRGVVTCMAKGARRKRSPLAAALDTFNRVELVYYWKDGRSVQTLAEASVLDGFRRLKADLEKSAYAAFPVELAGKAAGENAPAHGLYDTLVRGLAGMETWSGDVRTHACWQALHLLTEAGFAPVLGRCAHTGQPITGACGFRLDSGVVAPGERADRRLPAEVHDALCRLAEHGEACPEIAVDRAVFYVLRHYAAYQLESDFRSARVIEQMFD